MNDNITVKVHNTYVVSSISFKDSTMNSQFNFKYANGLEGHIELILERDHEWIVQLPMQHEPEDIEQLLNEITSKDVASLFPGWKYCNLKYQHIPDIGWVIKSELDPFESWNNLLSKQFKISNVVGQGIYGFGNFNDISYWRKNNE